MFINRLKCTTLVYFLIIIVQANKLQYRQNQQKRTPSFYKIFERDREVYVQNDDYLNGHKALLNLLEIIKDGSTDEIGYFQQKRVAKNKPFKTESPDDVQYHNRLPQTVSDIKEHEELSANVNDDVENLKAQLNFLRTKAGDKLPACYEKIDVTQLDAMPPEVRSVFQKSLLRAIAPPLHTLLHEDPWKIRHSKKKNYTFQKYPCPYFPHKSIWNSWTFKHPVYIDDCPDQLVNINGVCSNTPPHRMGREDAEDALLNMRFTKKKSRNEPKGWFTFD